MVPAVLDMQRTLTDNALSIYNQRNHLAQSDSLLIWIARQHGSVVHAAQAVRSAQATPKITSKLSAVKNVPRTLLKYIMPRLTKYNAKKLRFALMDNIPILWTPFQ